MNFDQALEVERRGATAGLNPMFGEWQHRFPFSPVPYGNGRALGAFKEKIRAELDSVKFLYSGSIQIEIKIFVDLQTTLETSDNADLDNYAKSILDGLRGPNGIMFDDTQVQALCISWIDSHEVYFTVAAKASPDDFVLKGIAFYEMPDGLFYPHGKRMWTNGEAEETSDLSFFAGLLVNQMMSHAQRSARIAFRNAGYNRLQAYRTSSYFASSARGYHKTRVSGAGFALVSRKDWLKRLEDWKSSDPARISEIEAMMGNMQENYDAVVHAVTK